LSNDEGTIVGSWNFYYEPSASKVAFSLRGGVEVAGTIVENVWSHVAAVRNGSTFYLYVNGVEADTAAASDPYYDTNGIRIGRLYTIDLSRDFGGHIDELQIINGTALYTENFCTSNTPYENAILPCTDDGIDPVLLLHMDGTNGGTTFVDNGASAHPISTGGAVNTSTTQTKFGSASAEFDDSTSYLTVPDSVDWDFYNGDFTIDFWVYLNSLSSGSQFFIGQYESASINYQFYFDQTFGFVHAIEDGGPQHAVMIQNNTTGWSANTWHHVALTRSGNTWRIFLDGTQVVTTNDSGPIGDMTGPLWIGAFGNNTNYLDGYMDELRIIKGSAVWTSNFTPPISAYCDVDSSSSSSLGDASSLSSASSSSESSDSYSSASESSSSSQSYSSISTLTSDNSTSSSSSQSYSSISSDSSSSQSLGSISSDSSSSQSLSSISSGSDISDSSNSIDSPSSNSLSSKSSSSSESSVIANTDSRIRFPVTTIDFTNDVGETGQPHDDFPNIDTAPRYDWMRLYMIGLLGYQSSESIQPENRRTGTIWFCNSEKLFKCFDNTNFVEIKERIDIQNNNGDGIWAYQYGKFTGNIEESIPVEKFTLDTFSDYVEQRKKNINQTFIYSGRAIKTSNVIDIPESIRDQLGSGIPSLYKNGEFIIPICYSTDPTSTVIELSGEATLEEGDEFTVIFKSVSDIVDRFPDSSSSSDSSSSDSTPNDSSSSTSTSETSDTSTSSTSSSSISSGSSNSTESTATSDSSISSVSSNSSSESSNSSVSSSSESSSSDFSSSSSSAILADFEDISDVPTEIQMASYINDITKPELDYQFEAPLTTSFVAIDNSLLPGGAPADADTGIRSALRASQDPYDPTPEYTKVPPTLDYQFEEPLTLSFSAINVDLLPGGAPAEADTGIDSAARASQDPYDPTTLYTKTKPSTALPVSTWPA
jgi:hypothetical protein